MSVKLHRKGIVINSNSDTLKIGSTNYYKRKAGQLVYGKQNLFNGAMAIIPDEFNGYLTSNDVPALDIDKFKVLPEYFILYIGRRNYNVCLETLSSGTGSKRIHEKTLFKIIESFPTIEEQQKITDFLLVLDNRIDQTTRKVEILKDQKKWFMKQMFV